MELDGIKIGSLAFKSQMVDLSLLRANGAARRPARPFPSVGVNSLILLSDSPLTADVEATGGRIATTSSNPSSVPGCTTHTIDRGYGMCDGIRIGREVSRPAHASIALGLEGGFAGFRFHLVEEAGGFGAADAGNVVLILQ